MTPQQIIIDFFASLAPEEQFPAINHFLSLYIVDHVHSIEDVKVIDQFLNIIELQDDVSDIAILFLKKRKEQLTQQPV